MQSRLQIQFQTANCDNGRSNSSYFRDIHYLSIMKESVAVEKF